MKKHNYQTPVTAARLLTAGRLMDPLLSSNTGLEPAPQRPILGV